MELRLLTADLKIKPLCWILSGPKAIIRVLIDGSKAESEMQTGSITGFKSGGRAALQEMQEPPEAGRGKKKKRGRRRFS